MNELLLFVLEELRSQQERIDELTISHFALVMAAAKRDEPLADAYISEKEANEYGEMGQRSAASLNSMDQLITRMRSELSRL